MNDAEKGASAPILVRQAADEIAAVAASLEQLGDLDAARIAYRAAAEIDLGDSELQQSWGGPFNGQQKRCALFLDLIERADPQAIIETGTYRGTTTKFMAEHFQRAIFTCEIVPRQFFQSQKKLAIYPQVSVVEADSRRFLEDILTQKADGTPLFIYLDAHWQEDLPLREELEIILHHRQPSIIMVDDFRVPFDEGYKFDDYGPGKVLDLRILGFLRDEPVQIFFPKTPSEHETGAKRGCVVLSTADLAPLVEPSALLRAADWRDWMLVQCQTELSQAMAERTAGEAQLTELKATLAAERAAGEARLTELEATLAAERAAGEAQLTELKATLAAEQAAGEARLTKLEAERAAGQARLTKLEAERAAGEARLTELETTLAAERAAGEARLTELETTLAAQRAAGQARLTELEATRAAERAAGEARLTELEATLAALRVDRVKHEVPRLGGSPQIPIACDTQDAAGLLRIVEAQASDLVRLRRALLSAQTVAAQRLLVIDAGASEWIRSIVLEEITRIQDAISDVVERSRWRRIGQRLGVAKQLAWETGRWQADLTGTTNGSTPSAEDRVRRPSVAQLMVEFERLHGQLDQLRLSRWRKLGHWLGLAKRLPWEAGAWRHPLLTKPFPEEPGSSPGAEVRAVTSRSSYAGFIEYINERFLEECHGFATDVIFDVGANTGQFAQGLRASGYHGHLISFEPLSGAHATLVAAAASDPLWDVAERCAVGASDRSAEINIAGNSYSSSLLPMLDLHREAAPQSAYQGTESCRVITLDSYIERTFSDPTTLFGLKIDTQGYEAEVLAGLRRNHGRVKVIVCEMSLAPLYAGGPSMSELSHLLAELGYHCVALGPEFEDPRTGELLEANGVFVKRQ